MIESNTPLRGLARFEIKRPLGEGGMGAVYEAFDKERQRFVALKVLKHLSPQGLLLFKNEFRSLADLHHPHLIQLYELFSEEELWFFSMELLPGQDLLSFIRSNAQPPEMADTLPELITAESSSFGSAPTAPTLTSIHAWSFDEVRLRAALGQLSLGISALHAAGKIHRDIKPSNVMIVEQGPGVRDQGSGGNVRDDKPLSSFLTPDNRPLTPARLVLMDFGLVREVSLAEDGPKIVGTPLYMAPEQAAGLAVGVEADWYAVGVILYQALTGQLPFQGSLSQILIGKQQRDPVPPKALSTQIPEDLNALCIELLQRQPSERPKEDEILRRLGVKNDPGIEPLISLPSSPFVGRAEELARLKELYEESQQKREALCVFVHGESGVGKSALLRQFLGSLPVGPIILSGRCYEQESVPYKALDGAIDALSRYLSKLDQREAAQLLPKEAQLIARVFPVLRQVRALEATLPPTELQDPFELRSRVFLALRELFINLSSRAPVVLFIDDLQWTDSDSVLLLSEILRPPEAPALFLLASVRGRGPQDPTFLALLSKLGAVSLQNLLLGGLSPLDASALVRMLRGEEEGEARWDAETGGHPLFIQEMARAWQAARHTTIAGGSPPKLEEVLLRRMSGLEEESKLLLELSAVSGAPLPQGLLAKASSLSRASFSQRVLALRTSQLLRSVGLEERDPIEPYHDRVRETLLAHLDTSTRRRHHRKLAETFEGTEADPQTLLRHWEGAGEAGRAAPYAMQAADQARSKMAFEQAAELYRAALRLAQPTKEEERSLRYRLAESLSCAGKGREAADAFLAAAEGAPKAERLKRQSQAMYQLLSSGHMEDGLTTARALLSEIGERWPESTASTLAMLLWHRAAVRLRGLGWSQREESEIPAEELLRVDVHEQLSTSLASVDLLRGALFQASALRRALELGEPRRIIRGLSREASFIAIEGSRHYPRAWALIEEIRRHAELHADPEMLAWVSFGAGLVCQMTGRSKEILPFFVDAERRFREQVPGSSAAFNITVVQRLWVLSNTGSFRELARLVPEHLKDAVRRGDRFTEISMLRAFTIIWLVKDEPAEAHRWLARAVWNPPGASYLIQDVWGLFSRITLALYEGADLSSDLQARFQTFSRSLLTQCETVRAYCHFLRGSLLLMEANKSWFRIGLLRELEQLIKGFHKIPAEFARVWGGLLEAGLAALRKQPKQALRLFEKAAQAADQIGLPMEAAAARLRQGEILGGEEGAALIAQAKAVMSSEDIKDPERFAQIYSPRMGSAVV